MANRSGDVSKDVATGYGVTCDHCGKGMEVIVVPKEGQTFAVPRKIIDQLLRVAQRLDNMNVKMIQLQRTDGRERKGSTSESVEPPST